MTSIEHNYIVHETAGAAYRSAAVKVERSGSEERSAVNERSGSEETHQQRSGSNKETSATGKKQRPERVRGAMACTSR